MSPVPASLLAAALAWKLVLALALLGGVSSTVYLAIVLAAARRFRIRARQAKQEVARTPENALPPVTLLKPVHGMEPRLAENLAGFFEQDYPRYEVIFGARDAGNAALHVANEVRARYPHIPSRVVLSGVPEWPNAKVFSLQKMIAEASSPYLVISDSDILVGKDFLRNVIPPLLDPATGLVTCLYRGIPAHDFWSLLEGLGMSVEFPSGVMVADMMEGMRFAMGAVMAVRADALAKIGGIAATADYYSDDFVLGNEVWTAGFKVVLSHHLVGHVLVPRTIAQTFGDQLRWMKSTRYSRPAGHLGTGLTFAMPYGVLGLAACAGLGHGTLGAGLLLAAYLNRVTQSVAVGWGVIRDARALRYCWLYPLRDFQGFLTWMGSYLSRTFYWRGELYRFGKGGRITPQHPRAASATPERP